MKKLPHILLLILSVGVFGCATPSLLSKQEKIPFIGSSTVTQFNLKNGLTVLVLEDHSSPTFSYQTWFRVGSKNETPGYTGLAHLFEHMMFKETKNLKPGEFDRTLEKAGAEGENAFTSRDYTAYVQELPSDKLELIAKLEAERMTQLIVNQKAFKTETEVVQNERRYRNENSPEGKMYQELFETAYTKHSYRWPVIGYQKDLDQMNAKDASSFYKKFYKPSEAIIVVVGDVKPSKVLRLVDKYYGKITSNGQKRNDSITKEPQQKRVRRKTLRLGLQIEKLYMVYHVPEVTHEDTAAFEVLQALLSDGKSSRLTRSLVDTGICTSISSGAFHNQDPSLFGFFADMQKNKKASVAESVILRELKRLTRNKPTENELERAKNIVEFNFLNSIASNSKKSRFLGRYHVVANNFQNGLNIYKNVKTVSGGDIQKVVKKYFNRNNRVVIKGIPK